MVYAFATIDITNADRFAEYRAVAMDALARHGGKVEASSASFTTLDGAPATPGAAALLSFPDKGAAEAWANDPDLAEVHAMRRAAGKSEILLMA